MKTTRQIMLSIGLLGLGMLMQVACTSTTNTERVRPLLEGYEWKLEAERFEQLPDNSDLALMAIVKDTELRPNYYQFRGLTALRLYPNSRVANFLEKYLTENDSSPHLRRALESYASAFASTSPDRVEKISGEFLQHSDAHLRIAAAKILKKLDRNTSRRLVQEYLNQETEKWIHDAIEEK